MSFGFSEYVIVLCYADQFTTESGLIGPTQTIHHTHVVQLASEQIRLRVHIAPEETMVEQIHYGHDLLLAKPVHWHQFQHWQTLPPGKPPICVKPGNVLSVTLTRP